MSGLWFAVAALFLWCAWLTLVYSVRRKTRLPGPQFIRDAVTDAIIADLKKPLRAMESRFAGRDR